MTDGREQRQQVEALQARAKQARLELELDETDGFSEQLTELTAAATAAEKDAGLIERDARATSQRLASTRHDVDEAERQLLAPKTVQRVSPAVVAFAFGLGVAGLWQMVDLFRNPVPTEVWLRMLGLGCALVPPPLLAWIWRRRLSGGATSRSRP